MCKFSQLGFLFLSLSMFAPQVLARSPFEPHGFVHTHHGRTHAAKEACDPLKADGVTRGLYSLCVAFCRAERHAEKLATRMKKVRGWRAAPDWPSRSERILAYYNRKKQATDPDMPSCSVVEEPVVTTPSCPCWSASEADAIDGILSDGSTATGWPAPSLNPSACSVDPRGPYIVETAFINGFRENTFIRVREVESTPPVHECQYQQVLGGLEAINTLLSVENGTLTAEEHAACKADLLARQTAMDLCQPVP